MFILLVAGVSSQVWGDNVTYTFTSKSWEASGGNWTSGKAGNDYNSGVQVTSGTSGANATSPTSFTNITKIVVNYHTNASKGAGSIALKIGSNTAKSQTVTKTGGTSSRTLEYDYSSSPETGSIKLTVTCTTNSIYVESVTITTAASGGGTTTSDLTVTSPLAVTVGGTNTIAYTTSSTGAMSFTSTDTSIATVDGTGKVTGVAEGSTTITVSQAADATYAASGNKTVTVNVSAASSTTYTKVTSASGLVAGKRYILVYEESKTSARVMGAIGTYGASISGFTISDNKITVTSQAVNVLTLSTNGTNSSKTKYKFSTSIEGDYLYWDSGNSLKVSSDNTTSTDWFLEYTDGILEITNVATQTRVLRYNTGSPRFACYEGTQQSVALYVEEETGTPPTFTPASIADQELLVGNIYVTDDISVNSNGTISVSSSNTAAATAEWNNSTKKVTVTSVAVGETTITISAAANGDYKSGTLTFNVTVVAPSVTLNKSTTSIQAGNTETLTATTAHPTNAPLTWTSDNTDVATVSQSGVVTAVGYGTAVIKAAFTSDASVYATCTVSVTRIPRTITIDQTAMALNIGNSEQRVGTLSPNVGTLSYSSNNTSVATVDADGTVHAVAEGSCTITASVAAEGNYDAASASYTVNVTDPSNLSFTWNLTIDDYESASASSVLWSSDFATMTLNQGSAQAGANNYLGGTGTNDHTRFYANQYVTLAPVTGYEISKVVFTTTTTGQLDDDWTNGTASASSGTVTVTPTDKTAAMSYTLSGTARVTGVTVHYKSSKPAAATITSISPASPFVRGVTGTFALVADYATTPNTVTWSSSNSSVLSVNASTGAYEALEAGTANITVTVTPEDDSYVETSKTFSYTVISPTITLSSSAEEIAVNGSVTLTASTTNAGGATINWSTSSTAKATISPTTGTTCTVTGVAAGTSTITARIVVNGITYEATCKVTVSAGEASGYFQLVESDPGADNWGGSYLIVYTTDTGTSSDAVAMDGSLTEMDVANNTIGVEIASKKIPLNSTTSAAAFTISGNSTDGYTIKGSCGDYIGNNGDSNKLTTSETALSNSIAYNEGNVDIIAAGGSYLRYNANDGNLRFRYYKSSSYTSQQAINLYKKVVTSGGGTGTFAFNTESITKKVGNTWPAIEWTGDNSESFTYTSSDESVVQVVNSSTGEMKAIGVGTARITCNVAADDYWSACSDYYDVTVTKGDCDLTLTSDENVTVTTSTTTTTITYTTSSTGAITSTSNNTSVATVSQGTGNTLIVTLTGTAGTATISFGQAADDNYEASTSNIVVTVVVESGGSSSASGYYVRLSGGEIPEDDYLIVYEASYRDPNEFIYDRDTTTTAYDQLTISPRAMDGSTIGGTDKLYAPYVEVDIADDRIAATTALDNAMYHISGTGSQFQVMSVTRNKYIGDNGAVANTSNYIGETETVDSYYNTASIEQGEFKLMGSANNALGVGGATVPRYLRYNAQNYPGSLATKAYSGDGSMFRFYRLDNYVMTKLSLYRRVQSDEKFVQFIPHEGTIGVGETLATTIATQNTTGTPVYSSGNENVATVDANGVITGVSAGQIDIQVTVDGVSNYFNLTVTSPQVLSRYIKVTENAEITEGEYLIVSENAGGETANVMDGSLTIGSDPVAKLLTDATIETDKDTVNYAGRKAIGATSNVDNAKFIAHIRNSKYYVQSNSAYYIGRTTETNGIEARTGAVYSNTLTADADNAQFKGSGGEVYLKYNATNGTFMYYYTSAETDIQLYKKVYYNYKLFSGDSEPRLTPMAAIEGPVEMTNNEVAVYDVSTAVAADHALMDNIQYEPNVVVNGTAYHLKLSDKVGGVYTPFYAPASFTTAQSLTYSRGNAGGWNSVCLPVAIPYDQIENMFGEGAEIWRLKGLSDEAQVEFEKLTEGNQVPAGEPVLINSNSTAWDINKLTGDFTVNGVAGGEVNITEKQAMIGSIALIGTYKQIIPGEVSGSKLYKLTSTGSCFGKMSATAKVYPFRMYLKFTPAAGSEAPAELSLSLLEDSGETTGIVKPRTEKDERWYDLSGRAVDHPTRKGIYVRNGKKVIVK